VRKKTGSFKMTPLLPASAPHDSQRSASEERLRNTDVFKTQVITDLKIVYIVLMK
jgi:hypothetical protein